MEGYLLELVGRKATEGREYCLEVNNMFSGVVSLGLNSAFSTSYLIDLVWIYVPLGYF